MINWYLRSQFKSGFIRFQDIVSSYFGQHTRFRLLPPLNAHAGISSRVRGYTFGPIPHLYPYFAYENSEGSGEYLHFIAIVSC